MRKRIPKILSLKLLLIVNYGVVFGAVAATPALGGLISKTLTDKVNLRIRQQIIQIQRDFTAGKVTKDQAASLKAQVKAIRQQEVADLKQNGTKTLTDAQVADLNGQLNTLSKSIPR